jgi:hypothetical protein
MPAGLDPAVVGVGGLEDGERRGRVGEEGRDLAQHRRAIATRAPVPKAVTTCSAERPPPGRRSGAAS